MKELVKIEIPEGGKIVIRGTQENEKHYVVLEVEEKGLEWDGEKLVKTKSNIPKAGDLCIIFNRDYSHAFIAKYAWFLDSCYDNIIKWDGTKEQYEKVLRGKLK